MLGVTVSAACAEILVPSIAKIVKDFICPELFSFFSSNFGERLTPSMLLASAFTIANKRKMKPTITASNTPSEIPDALAMLLLAELLKGRTKAATNTAANRFTFVFIAGLF
jgi:hypothetical protein